MFLRASDYPAILRAVEVLKIFFAFNLVLFPGLIPLKVEPEQNTLAEQYTVVALLEAHVINTSVIHWEDLPVSLDLQFQFGSKV